MSDGIIHVAAAAILDNDGKVLLSKRAEGSHQGGLWEFPGGKLEAGEDIHQGLNRELVEELGISVTDSRPLIKITHHYADRSVCLDVHAVTAFEGKPEGLEGQPIRWCAIADIDCNELPAADVPVVNALKLPDRYLITGSFESVSEFETRLQRAIHNGIRLVQLRIKADWLDQHQQDYAHILEISKNLCQSAGCVLMLNVPEKAATAGISNLHADSRKLEALDKRPQCEWFSASCHTIEDLHRAQYLGADFAVLSPVQHTTSHPDTEPLGWGVFTAMLEHVNIPVYALGGVDASHIDRSQQSGGQGVAGIGAFWE